jgi:hypothetical protein
VIAVLGLLLTTGGYDVLEPVERDKAKPVAQEAWAITFQEAKARSNKAEAILDVQLHTQAHLQASGGTPTAAATELADNEGTEAAGTVDGVLDRLQAPLEPQYGGVGRTAELICAYPWPQGCDYWIAIAFCESSLRPSALGFGGYYVGLFQVWTGHGYEYDRLLEPLYNTQAAWELSYEGIYTRPWPRCQWQ